jgi:polysaccharide pyruvyl transferase WcaK-like protein
MQASRRTHAPEIVLLGLFGVGNLGNDATLEVTLHHLRRRVAQARVLCVCADPAKIRSRYDVATARLNFMPPWSFWRVPGYALRQALVVLATLVTEPVRRLRVAKELSGAQQLLVVGTGILDDFGELPWRVPLWLWRWCDVARRSGLLVGFLAVGAGPINNPLNRSLMAGAVRMSHFRSFRDRVSRDYLANLGLDTSQDSVVPDLVFGLPQERLPNARNPLTPPRTIGVGLMAYYGWANQRERGRETYAAYIQKMSRFVTWLLDEGYKVRLLIGQEGADERPVSDLRDEVTRTGRQLHASELVSASITTLDDLLSELAQTDLVVATRYHNLICAMLLGRPVIALGYAAKFDALMRDMQLEGYCQDVERLDVDLLIEQFRSLASDHARVADLIEEKCRSYRAQIEKLYDSLWA